MTSFRPMPKLEGEARSGKFGIDNDHRSKTPPPQNWERLVAKENTKGMEALFIFIGHTRTLLSRSFGRGWGIQIPRTLLGVAFKGFGNFGLVSRFSGVGEGVRFSPSRSVSPLSNYASFRSSAGVGFTDPGGWGLASILLSSRGHWNSSSLEIRVIQSTK
jgi:hypothetical protein